MDTSNLIPLAGLRRRPCLSFLLFALFGACGIAAHAERERWEIGVETGAQWLGRNDVRIPGDDGTGFDMRDLTGKDAEPYVRLAAEYRFLERHALRLVAAPIRRSGTGRLDEPVHFAGEDFAPDVATRGVYQFSSYRLLWRYTVRETDRWGWSIGAVGFVRDAKVELRQGPTHASDSNVGFVPLAHLSAWAELRPGWTLDFELEGLAGGPGRAFDGILALHYHPTDRSSIGVGYRALEGGVDNDDVYNFAWVHHAVFTAQWRL